MTEKERMISGRLYRADDPELLAGRARARVLTERFNAIREADKAQREPILRELLGSVGGRIYMEPTFHCDYGYNICVGDNFYANYDCIILDVAPVTIGRNVFFAPRVGVYTAGHPIDAGVRNEELEFGKPITIGDDVWIGGNVVINPGVSIGSDVVIGSGSVVTRDIPDHVIAVGNPCRVLRSITQEDRAHWLKLREEYYNG